MKNFSRRLPSCSLLITLGVYSCFLFVLLTATWFNHAKYCCLHFVIRQNEQLSKYGDTKSARSIMLVELKKLIEANPLFRDKLSLPAFKSSRLRTLINQRLFITYSMIILLILGQYSLVQSFLLSYLVKTKSGFAYVFLLITQYLYKVHVGQLTQLSLDW